MALAVKNLPANAGDIRDGGLTPGEVEMGRIPWRRAWEPSPVGLPGESHGQRSLVGYSPWGHKESDTTEQLSNSNILDLLLVETLGNICKIPIGKSGTKCV